MNLLSSLRYLVALHEHRHFGRVAQACNITHGPARTACMARCLLPTISMLSGTARCARQCANISLCLPVPRLHSPMFGSWIAPNTVLINPDVWKLVCMVAVDAMDYGRRLMWQQRDVWPDPGPASLIIASLIMLAKGTLPRHVVNMHIVPRVRNGRDVAVQAVGRAAAAHFWYCLQDFVMKQGAVSPWPLSPGHPFLCVRHGLLQLNLPVGVPDFLPPQI